MQARKGGQPDGRKENDAEPIDRERKEALRQQAVEDEREEMDDYLEEQGIQIRHSRERLPRKIKEMPA